MNSMDEFRQSIGQKRLRRSELYNTASLLLALRKLLIAADEKHDGHVTMMRYATGWVITLGVPSIRHDECLKSFPQGMTLTQAINRALKFESTWSREDGS